MNQKQKRSIPFHQYIISVICVAFLSAGGMYILINRNLQMMNNKPEENSERLSGDLGQIQQLYEQITQNYVGKVDSEKLIDGALKGMTSALDDPYSAFMSGIEAQNLNDSISGSFEGIGATLSIENELPIIAQAPIKGSPAEKANLKAKDIILKVDNQDVKGQTLTEIVGKVRGKKGSEVTLTIQREEAIFDVKLVRDVIPIDSVIGKIDPQNPTVGNIKITNFAQTTFEELQKSIQELRKAGAKSFVLDVRQNPGGLLDQVEKMSSMFLKDGQIIVQFEDKAGNKQVTKAGKELDGGFKVKEPVVVLIDGGSASASEIFAGALHESAGVELIGTKTFGKGTVQNVMPVTSNSELKLTILKWLTPEGNWIHEKGIEPTIKADFPSFAYLLPIDKSQEFKEGQTGPAIKNINDMLIALELLSTTDESTFTQETAAAVKSFQESHQLEVTGIVNKDTAVAIEESLRELLEQHDTAYNEAVKNLTK